MDIFCCYLYTLLLHRPKTDDVDQQVFLDSSLRCARVLNKDMEVSAHKDNIGIFLATNKR